MHEFQCFITAGELLGEDPRSQEDPGVRDVVPSAVLGLNGAFPTRAVERGIDRDVADVWLHETEALAKKTGTLGDREAVDLAVRLMALGFVMSDASAPDGLAPRELLAEATVQPEVER